LRFVQHADSLVEGETLADRCRKILRSRAYHDPDATISKSPNVVSGNGERRGIQPLRSGRTRSKRINAAYAVRPHITTDAPAARGSAGRIRSGERWSQKGTCLKQRDPGQLPAANQLVRRGADLSKKMAVATEWKRVYERTDEPMPVSEDGIPVIRPDVEI